jgi:hypothetical protein
MQEPSTRSGVGETRADVHGLRSRAAGNAVPWISLWRWLAAKKIHDFEQLVLLKQPDAGDPGSSSIKADTGILQCYPAQCEHTYSLGACLPQGGHSARDRAIFLLKYRPEDDEAGTFIGSPRYLVEAMAGDRDRRRSDRARSREFPDFFYFQNGNVLGAQMYAIRSRSHGHITSRIDQKLSLRLWAIPGWACATDDFNRLTRQPFQFASAEIFFSKLDVVHSTTRRLGNVREQESAAASFVT